MKLINLILIISIFILNFKLYNGENLNNNKTNHGSITQLKGELNVTGSNYKLNYTTLIFGNEIQKINDSTIILSNYSNVNIINNLTIKNSTIYGNGTINNGFEIINGTIGNNYEITKLEINNGDLKIKNGSKIQLFIKSEFDYSTININNGSLDIQDDSILEIYIDLNYSTTISIPIIKSKNGTFYLTNNNNLSLNISSFNIDSYNQEMKTFSNYKLLSLIKNNEKQNTNNSKSYLNSKQNLIIGISIASFATVSLIVFLIVWFNVIKRKRINKNGMQKIDDN